MSDNVDYSQRTAGGPEGDDASRTAEQTIKIIRKVQPHFWRLHDPEELAKLKEELRDAALGVCPSIRKSSFKSTTGCVRRGTRLQPVARKVITRTHS